jgi:hypothetical protein
MADEMHLFERSALKDYVVSILDRIELDPEQATLQSATASHSVVGIVWRPQGASNPCYRRERARVSRAQPCYAGCLCHSCVFFFRHLEMNSCTKRRFGA